MKRITPRHWAILLGLLLVPEVTLFLLITNWLRRRRALKTLTEGVNSRQGHTQTQSRTSSKSSLTR